MEFSLHAKEVVESSTPKCATKRHEATRNFRENEVQLVQILWSKGIRFSMSKGKARKQSPIAFLVNGQEVPTQLKNVVLTKEARPGNKCWGKIDYFVNHRGFRLLDERK